MLRNLLSLLMLAMFALPSVSPLFDLGAGGDAGLPACCRRNGAHHCGSMGTAGNTSVPGHSHWNAPPPLCPYSPGTTAGGTHLDLSMVPMRTDVRGGPVTLAGAVAQTESRWRLARERARGKRGPPSLIG